MELKVHNPPPPQAVGFLLWIHTMELKASGTYVNVQVCSMSLGSESIQWNWKTWASNMIGSSHHSAESIQWNWKLQRRLQGADVHIRANPYNGIERVVPTSCEPSLLYWIHTMELKDGNYIYSAPREPLAWRIHTMELKVGRGACSTYMLFREPNPYNGIERTDCCEEVTIVCCKVFESIQWNWK